MRRLIPLFVIIALLPFLLAQDCGKTFGNKFISVVRENGRWWFVNSDNSRFLSKGVNAVLPVDWSARPGERHFDATRSGRTIGAWAKEASAQLERWGFNTVGCWSHEAVFSKNIFTVILGMQIKTNGKINDVFSPDFEARAEKITGEICAKYKDDPLLLGYFLENEQPWYGDFGWYTGHSSTIMDVYLNLSVAAEGRKQLVRLLAEKYKSITDFNALFGTGYGSWAEIRELEKQTLNNKALTDLRNGFLAIVADRYYQVATQKIRKADPNHLVLGDRFANFAPKSVIKACAKYCDVVSLNYYLGYKHVNASYLEGFVIDRTKPLLITEFSYRAVENNSGLKNTKGADVTVPTQNDRAVNFGNYVSALCRLPFVVGYHWFQYFDEPPAGRSFDGEDSNYGLLDIDGREYTTLLNKITEVNLKTDAIHRESGSGPSANPFWIDEPVRVNRDSGQDREKMMYCVFDQASNNIFGWADTANKGMIGSAVTNNSASVSFRTGSGWGCGISIAPNHVPVNADQSVDARGFRGIELKIQVPRKVKFSLFVTESGADETGKENYPGAGTADGEGFSSLEMTGAGKMEILKVDFTEFYLRLNYGNQEGNKAIDLSAIRNIDVYLPGNQGNGELTIEFISLY